MQNCDYALYCLANNQAWCMTRSEWAAWAQFMATSFAMLVTIGIAWWASHAPAKQAVEASKALGVELGVSLSRMQLAAQNEDQKLLIDLYGGLADVSNSLRQIREAQLSPAWIERHVELVKMATRGIEIWRRWHGNTQKALSARPSDLAPQFNKLAIHVGRVLDPGHPFESM